MDAKAAVDTLKRLSVKSLGFVAKASMSAALYEYIRENLSGVTFKDATDLVDETKAIKSEEEIQLIKQTAEMHDIVFAAALAMVRPGVREYELRSEIQRLCTNWGSEEQLIMIGSAPAGKAAGQVPTFFQNRTLQYGDSVCIMIEVNGAGGFYGELGRTVCLGEASKSLLKLWADMVKLQDKTAALLKPDAKPAELIEIHNNSLTKMGYPRDSRLYAHGQGYDLVERPGIRPEETMTIKAGMNMAVHPMTSTEEAYAFCCDNYIVTNSGAVRIHKTPREVFVV
jgi:Xaa-Pro aminopeptidase